MVNLGAFLGMDEPFAGAWCGRGGTPLVLDGARVVKIMQALSLGVVKAPARLREPGLEPGTNRLKVYCSTD